MRKFIEEILKEDFKENYENIFENSELLQYIDKKTNAITGNSKSRKNLGNIYAIYAFMYFYSEKFYNDPENYKKFEGFEYSDLWNFCKKQYGGEKIQNHALNNRLNTEFANKVAKEPEKMLLIINGSKYLMHIDYIYVNGIDISLSVLKIIKKYIELLFEKDMKLINDLEDLMQENDINKKKSKIINLLDEDSEARIFEIISFAVLKAHYKNEKIYIGKSIDTINEEYLKLYKTGRTNANDGGIDFVMKPLGRFFQVTEVDNYDKYLLDMDKVLHFPITFVVKTNKKRETIVSELNQYILLKSGGMETIINNYKNSIEEIITINELKMWLNELLLDDINLIIKDIDLYYRIEMNMELLGDIDE